MYAINETVQIVVSRNGGEPNFDKACEQAYSLALQKFGCDDDGHFNNVKDSDRTSDRVVIEFKSYRHIGTMVGQTCEYIFEAWVEHIEVIDPLRKNDDDNDAGGYWQLK